MITADAPAASPRMARSTLAHTPRKVTTTSPGCTPAYSAAEQPSAMPPAPLSSTRSGPLTGDVSGCSLALMAVRLTVPPTMVATRNSGIVSSAATEITSGAVDGDPTMNALAPSLPAAATTMMPASMAF